MNYQALYDFIEDISQNLGLTTKFFHGRLEILNLESDFQGLNIHCLPFTASGNTTEGAQINTSWVLRILFLQQDKCDSAIDQNDQDVIQEEIKTLATTQQAAEMFLRLVHENEINADLEKAADQLTINSFDFDNEIKIASTLMTGTMLTMNITVPDNFDYCDAVFTPLVPVTSFTYSSNPQSTPGTTLPMFASVDGDVLRFLLDANSSLPDGFTLNQTTGEIPIGVITQTEVFSIIAVGEDLFSSAKATVTLTFAGLEAPINLVATPISSTEIDLTWTNVTAGLTIQIERSLTTGSGFSLINTTGVDATSFSDTGLTASTQYFYRVRGTNGVEFSPYSSEANATTQSSISPEAQAVLNRFPNPLAAGEQDKIVAAVDALTGNGNDTIDSYFGLTLEDAGNRAQDWFRDASGTFVNSPTYVNGKGVSFNGSTQHFDTGIDLGTLTNYSLNDSYIEGFMYENRDAGNAKSLYGCDSGISNTTLLFQRSTPNIGMTMQDNDFSIIGSSLFLDNTRYGGKRTASNGKKLVIDGVDGSNIVSTSHDFPSPTLTVGARKDDGVMRDWIDASISYILLGGIETNNYNAFANEIITQWSLDV